MAEIDFANFAEKAKSDLLQLLTPEAGQKSLVIQKSLVGPLELLFTFSKLQERGVDRVFFLENDNVDGSQTSVVFIVSGEKGEQAQAVALLLCRLLNRGLQSRLTQIQRIQRTSSSHHDFSVCWVPRRTFLCDKVLEECGVLGDVTASEWPLYLLPLEKDLLSMELEPSFKELYLRRDPTVLFLAAKALMLIQQQHGLFPRIQGKGDNAKRLADILVRMRSEQAANQSSLFSSSLLRDSMPSSSIENIIIIDRDVDFATPLLTQLTYEGLIDETFGIRNNQAEINASILGSAPQQQQSTQSSSAQDTSNGSQTSTKRKVKLDSTDTLYPELRSANFSVIGGHLNRVARRLQNFQTEGKQGSNKTIAELRELITKVPGYQAEQQSLKLHTALAENIMKFTQSDLFTRVLEVQQNAIAGTDPSSLIDLVEDLIGRECPLPTALRILCLLSVVSGGLKQKDLDNFKRQIVQGYGYQHLLTLSALDKIGLLQQRSALSNFSISVPSTTSAATISHRTDYSSLRRPLYLILDEVSEEDPDDIAYAYSGYAPLSVRLVQCLIQKPYLASFTKGPGSATGAVSLPSSEDAPSWRGYEDVLRNAKGPTFDILQRALPGDEEKAVKARQTLSGAAGKKTTIVFFLGGITFSEIAALRFIANKEVERRNIVIATTDLISGDKMMRCAIAESGTD